MLEDFFITCIERRNGADWGSPLPQSKRIFQNGIVINFFKRCTEFILLLSTMFVEKRLECGSAFQNFELEIFNGASFFGCSHFVTQEWFMASIFHSITKRSYIRNGNVYIVWIECTIKHGCLSTLADTGGNPFAWIDLLEGIADSMKVVCTVLSGEILPVTWFWSRFQKITIFHKNHIGIKPFGELFTISRIGSIRSSVSFGHQYGRTVKTYMRNKYTLAEGTQFRIFMINGLSKVCDILFCKFFTFQRLYFGNVGNFFHLVLQLSLCSNG